MINQLTVTGDVRLRKLMRSFYREYFDRIFCLTTDVTSALTKLKKETGLLQYHMRAAHAIGCRCAFHDIDLSECSLRKDSFDSIKLSIWNKIQPEVRQKRQINSASSCLYQLTFGRNSVSHLQSRFKVRPQITHLHSGKKVHFCFDRQQSKFT